METLAPKISEVITSLIELQDIIGDQRVTLARWVEKEKAELPLPGLCGLGVIVHQSANGEIAR